MTAKPSTTPDRPSDAPPERLRRVVFPAEATKFFGRRGELEAIGALWERSHLITLVGPGGIGKTRLALQLARTEVDARVCIVDLASCQTAGDIEAAVAQAFPHAPSDEVEVIAALEDVDLLVLDNFEPLLQHAPATVGLWTAAHPELRILVTSRSPLAVFGEALFEVGPLALDAAARALFLDRAKARDHAFEIGDEAALQHLLVVTAGIPLAVELAAAQMRTTTLQDLSTRLEGREHDLGGGAANAARRHQTLQAAIQGSVEALDDATRAAFERLGVFVSAFDQEAAAAVFGRDATDALQALRDVSLLRSDVVGGRMFFDMYASIRAFASEHLLVRDDAHEIQTRHCLFFAGSRTQPGTGAASDEPNLVAARAFALVDDGADAPDWALQCSLALHHRAAHRGRPADATALLESIDVDNTSPNIAAAALVARAHHALVHAGACNAEDLEDAAAALRQSETAGDVDAIATAIDLAATEALDARVRVSDDVDDRYRKAVGLAEDADDTDRAHRIRSDFAASLFERGQSKLAREEFLTVIDEARETGDGKTEGVALTNLSLVEQERGALLEAERLLDLALEIHRREENGRFAAITQCDRASLATERGALLVAAERYTIAVEALGDVGDSRQQALGLSAFHFTLALLGEVQQAATVCRRAVRAHRKFSSSAYTLAHDIYAAGAAVMSASAHLSDAAQVQAREKLRRVLEATAADPRAPRADEVRLAARLVGGLVDTLDSPGGRYWFSLDGAVAVTPDQERIRFGEKPVQQALVAALVDDLFRNQTGFSREELITRGWPGEKMSDSSARNRLHVALASLRKVGLQDCVVHEDGRYRLAPPMPWLVLAGG